MIDSGQDELDPARRRRRRWTYVVVTLLVGGGVVLWPRWFGPQYPLPAIDVVERVVAKLEAEFDVPPVYWKRLWTALQPASLDLFPSKWVALGELAITTRDGHSVHVSLYRLPEKTGAFSTGPTHASRWYYRGGNSAELVDVLADAHLAANRRD
jgi:hypothetical protein